MMNKSHFTYIFILISVLFSEKIVAQSYTAGDQITLGVQDFCLIDTNHAPVALTLSASVAGTPVASVSNSDMYVKISSVVPGNTNRKVTARISGGTIPAGTRLTLLAALSVNLNGGGRRGVVVTTPIILNATDQDLVTGVGSCYTGTGFTDGYRLTYTWAPYLPATNYQLLQSTTTPTVITIVLTITAHDGNN
jgi:hypothetical protein